jgi:hypothetical protein
MPLLMAYIMAKTESIGTENLLVSLHSEQETNVSKYTDFTVS